MNKPAILGGTPVRNTKISYGRQYIDETDIQAVADVLRSGYVTCGPKVAELEKKICEVTGAKYAVAVSNGTAALHIACMAIDLGPGDEIITTPITFAASANCALYCGAKPVFADINPETYNISPAAIRNCITPATKAVVAVDFTGQAVELHHKGRVFFGCVISKAIFIQYFFHAFCRKWRRNATIAGQEDLSILFFNKVR